MDEFTDDQKLKKKKKITMVIKINHGIGMRKASVFSSDEVTAWSPEDQTTSARLIKRQTCG